MEIRYLKSGKIYIKFKNGVEWLMSGDEAEELVVKLVELRKGRSRHYGT